MATNYAQKMEREKLSPKGDVTKGIRKAIPGKVRIPYSAPKKMMSSDGYIPVKPKKVGVMDVVKEVPGATKKVLGTIAKAGTTAFTKPTRVLGAQIYKDLEFKEKVASPKTPMQKKAAEYLKNKKVY